MLSGQQTKKILSLTGNKNVLILIKMTKPQKSKFRILIKTIIIYKG